ncbi:hypothetical protein WN51_10033 [Melipona quadrifasciata]|uniref:Uncharacterized protein n=1 Tax=Melipona quadrifasciata TaxID=166423 RepID=A0A0N0U815_9HYME|nr:hypothetical protein WN51_10033 [Melipona quadrifasciata]
MINHLEINGTAENLPRSGWPRKSTMRQNRVILTVLVPEVFKNPCSIVPCSAIALCLTIVTKHRGRFHHSTRIARSRCVALKRLREVHKNHNISSKQLKSELNLPIKETQIRMRIKEAGYHGSRESDHLSANVTLRDN